MINELFLLLNIFCIISLSLGHCAYHEHRYIYKYMYILYTRMYDIALCILQFIIITIHYNVR